MHERLPNLVIGGVAKAATTSLFRYLRQHPEVCASSVKEARYFTPLRYGEPQPPLEDYARLFGHWRGERYRMEATPGYFAGGELIARAIDDLLPGSRVIVSFRDPVQRCWSWYRFMQAIGRIPKDLAFSAYLDRCLELHRRGVDGVRENQPFWGVGGGCYDAWIDDWQKVFGDRLRVDFFENIVEQPHESTARVCEWLGLDTAPCADFEYHVENRTTQYKNRRLMRWARQLNRRGERYFARYPQLRRALRGTYYRVNSDPAKASMDAASRERLEEFFAPHNERLAAQLTAAAPDLWPGWLAAARRP
jgi:hypothetical protein